MKPYGRLFIALMLAVIALIPQGVSVSLNDGPTIKVEGPDSLEGITTMDDTIFLATGQIQTAVNSADPGDIIFLWPKTYYGLTDVNKDLNIKGCGMGLTVVDGQKLGSVFAIDPGVTATLADMTIKNGQSSYGGGGIRNNGGILTLKRCELTGNIADSWGGGVFTAGGFTSSGDFSPDSLTVDGCNIHHNHAGYGGGGISTDAYSTLVVRNSQISFNTAVVWGGAMDIYGQDYFGGGTTITNNAFIGNSAPSGGAIFTVNGAAATVDRCAFMLNRAVDSGIGTYWPLPGHGGAVYDAGTMTITNSVFTNNFANIDGGAIFVDGGTLSQSRNYFASNRPISISP